MRTLDSYDYGASSYMKKRFTVRQAQEQINYLRRAWQLRMEEHNRGMLRSPDLYQTINTPLWRGNAINCGIVQMRKVRELARKNGTASRQEV